MTMPFYVPAEQMMKDKADFARKNIARGKALVALLFADGILIAAENTSATLRKVSEIYDRIAFAGAGKYNEYDRLRIAGVRHADTKGYLYSREDVDAQSLANAYAQMLGDVFTHEIKPMEVEIVVAELGAGQSGDRLFHIFYDGTVVDEEGFTRAGRGRGRGHHRAGQAVLRAGPAPGRGAAGRGERPGGPRPRSSLPPTWRWRCWPGATGAAPSAACRTRRWRPCWRAASPRRRPSPRRRGPRTRPRPS